jgi:hypothetical protein
MKINSMLIIYAIVTFLVTLGLLPCLVSMCPSLHITLESSDWFS